jgi:hypothetical protein
MATDFSVVYGSFLSKVTDTDLSDMTEEDANSVMSDLLKQATVKFSESCKKDLSDVTTTGFVSDLDDYEVDILSELMVEAWYKPHINYTDLLRNKLSTKDFTTFSPANLQKENRESYELAHKRARSMINEYSFRMNNIGDLK